MQRVFDGEDDSDNVSEASSTWTECKENYNPDEQQYNVERILAEHEDGGDSYYLIKWEGYDQCRSTWEPEDEIAEHALNAIRDWNERKLRIGQGEEEPLDLEAFYQDRDFQREEMLRRSARRKQRRARREQARKSRRGSENPDATSRTEQAPAQNQQFSSSDHNSLFYDSDDEPLALVASRKRSRRERHASLSDGSLPIEPVRRDSEPKRRRGLSGEPIETQNALPSALPKAVGAAVIGTERRSVKSGNESRHSLATEVIPNAKSNPSSPTKGQEPSNGQLQERRSAQHAGPIGFNMTSQKPLKKQRPRDHSNEHAENWKGPRIKTLSALHRYRTASAAEPAPRQFADEFEQVDLATGTIRRPSIPSIGITAAERRPAESPQTATTTSEANGRFSETSNRRESHDKGSKMPARSVTFDETIPRRKTAPKEPLASTPEPVDRLDITDDRKAPFTCPLWKRDGQCRDGDECVFLHRDSPYTASLNLKMQAGGNSWKFDNPLGRKAQTCAFWYYNDNGCEKSVDKCDFAHWNTGLVAQTGNMRPIPVPLERDKPQEALPAPFVATATASKSLPIQRKRPPHTMECFFYHYDRCSKTAEECRFAHYKCDKIADPPIGWKQKNYDRYLSLIHQDAAKGHVDSVSKPASIGTTTFGHKPEDRTSSTKNLVQPDEVVTFDARSSPVGDGVFSKVVEMVDKNDSVHKADRNARATNIDGKKVTQQSDRDLGQTTESDASVGLKAPNPPVPPVNVGNENLKVQLKFPSPMSILDVVLHGLTSSARQNIVAHGGTHQPLVVDNSCLAQNYQELLFQKTRTSAEAVGVVKASHSATIELLETYAETLKLNDAGAVISHYSFAIVLYPSRSDRWKAVKPAEELHSQNSPLLFHYRGPLDLTPGQLAVENGSGMNDRSYQDNFSRVFRDLPLLMVHKGERVQNFDSNPLFEWPNSSLARRVFLFYDKELHVQELNLMLRLFQARDVKVYHNGKSGSWNYWIHHRQHGGAILFHRDFHDYHRIPSLALFLQEKFTFWRVDKSLSIWRIFPRGTTVLLSDELIASRPGKAQQVLEHIKQKREAQLRGQRTWCFSARPDLKKWLDELFQANMKLNLKDKSVQSLNLLNLVQNMLDKDNDTNVFEFHDYISEYTDQAYVEPDLVQVRDHDELWRKDPVAASEQLVGWFGMWSLSQVHTTRRFLVLANELGQQETQWKNRWRHVDVLTPEKYFARFERS